MKKFLAFVAGAMLLLAAGNAMAISVDGDYWKNTDLTTGANGTITTMTFSAITDFTGTFGLYALDDYSNPATPTKILDIFSMPSTPGLVNVYFKKSGNDVLASLNTNWSDSDNVSLGSNLFGFYYKDTTTGTFYYTDEALNSSDPYILSTWDGTSTATFLLDLNLDGQGSQLVTVSDVAPVPEPGTILLLGGGLLGLGYFGRRRMRKLA